MGVCLWCAYVYVERERQTDRQTVLKFQGALMGWSGVCS